MQWTRGSYLLTDDPACFDVGRVQTLLNATDWAADWSRSLIERAAKHSVCFHLVHAGQQVGFARVITDHTTFACLCDVVVDPDHRGQGLGTWMLRSMLEHPALQTRTQALRTHSARELYAQFGFKPVEYLRRSIRPA